MTRGVGKEAVMGNWERVALTERGRVGNPPLRTARTEVLLYSAANGERDRKR